MKIEYGNFCSTKRAESLECRVLPAISALFTLLIVLILPSDNMAYTTKIDAAPIKADCPPEKKQQYLSYDPRVARA